MGGSFNPRNQNIICSPAEIFKKLDCYVTLGDVSNEDYLLN